jgi:hypothetical protein
MNVCDQVGISLRILAVWSLYWIMLGLMGGAALPSSYVTTRLRPT